MEVKTGEKIRKNILSGITYQVVVLALGIIVPRLYLENFGSEINGVLSTIKQIFAYMVLLEAGIGSASIQALYEPLGHKDRHKMNSILSATRIYYNKVGYIYSAILIALAAGYSLTVPESVSSLVVFGIVILTGLPSVFSYFVQSKYRVLLEAEGFDSVYKGSETILQVVSNIAKILILLYTDSLILIQFVYCALSILQLWYVTSRTKKICKWLDLRVEPDFKALSQSGSVMVHQISALVFNNTDILLLSFMRNYKEVSVYTIYSFFFTQAQAFIANIVTGFKFVLGPMFSREREKFLRLFKTYETLYIMGTFIIYTLMAVFLLPLVEIYTSGINDADYTNSYLILLFVIMSLLANGKLPSNHVLEISGKFTETRSHAIWEMIINILVSVVSICYFGICGALMGTVAALLYRSIMMIYYTNVVVLERSVFDTYRCWIVNGVIFTIIMFIFFVDSFSGLSFVKLLIKGIIHSLWIIPLYLFANFIFFKNEFINFSELWRAKNEHS